MADTYWHSSMSDGYLAPTANTAVEDFLYFARGEDNLPLNRSVWKYDKRNDGYPWVTTAEPQGEIEKGEFTRVQQGKYIYTVRDNTARELISALQEGKLDYKRVSVLPGASQIENAVYRLETNEWTQVSAMIQGYLGTATVTSINNLEQIGFHLDSAEITNEIAYTGTFTFVPKTKRINYFDINNVPSEFKPAELDAVKTIILTTYYEDEEQTQPKINVVIINENNETLVNDTFSAEQEYNFYTADNIAYYIGDEKSATLTYLASDADIVIDEVMSTSSAYPVANKVITSHINDITNNYLKKSGGALTGDVTTSITEFTDNSLVTKAYVANEITSISISEPTEEEMAAYKQAIINSI